MATTATMNDNEDEARFVFRINDNGTGPNLLHQVCLERGWNAYKPLLGDHKRTRWNLWWRTKRFPVSHYYNLDSKQFTNHIPNASFICRKDNLLRCIKCMKKIYGTSYDFVPVSFSLPSDYKKLMSMCDGDWKNGSFSLHDDSQVWICKPIALSQGRGISLVQNPRDLVYSSNVVVQQYVKNPLLIGGYKFDLRLYVLVPSFHPLTVYVYREGLARFGTDKFSLANLKNRFAHLTNSSLNKCGPGYPEIKERVGAGCKWSLRQLRCYLRQRVGSDWLLWQNISTLIVLTIASQLSKVPNAVNCFEFYGFDVLIDADLKPWLIEVNLSPALGADCSIDSQIKKPMMHDMFDLIGLPMDYTGLRIHANEKTEDEETRTKKIRKGRRRRPTLRRGRSHFEKTATTRWGNGKNWNFPDARQGNWVLIFPLLSPQHNRFKYAACSDGVRGTFAAEEVKSIVSSAASYQKIAKQLFRSNPNASISLLNARIASFLLPNSRIWLPPT